MMDLWHITWFTVVCAAVATLLVLPVGVSLAWLLARGRFPGRTLVETFVSLPLVMPPVATGLLLLILLGRRGPVGGLLERLGIEIVFTWKAVVLAMAVMGVPLLVRTARAGFEQVNPRFEHVAATLGARPLRVFFTISLPLAWPAVLGGAILAFARALGEFGATMIIAGSIPGVTRTLAVGIYSHVETGQDAQALVLVAISVAIAFASLWVANLLLDRASPKRGREGGGTP